MDYSEFMLARQLMTEERAGRRLRAQVADEDADYLAAIAAMSKRG